MLKKVMIICLALSFVFIGGIGFVLAGDCDGTQKRDRDKLKDGSISSDSNSIIIAGHGNDKGKGDQDRARDGSCLDS